MCHNIASRSLVKSKPPPDHLYFTFFANYNMLLLVEKGSWVNLTSHCGSTIWWNSETRAVTGVSFKPKSRDMSQQAEASGSPSSHGLLGMFWRCCWRCRLPGSQVCREWCSTGHHRDGMVCGERIWQQFDCCHPCGQTGLSEGRGSYLTGKNFKKLTVFLLHWLKKEKRTREERFLYLGGVFVRCVNLM